MLRVGVLHEPEIVRSVPLLKRVFGRGVNHISGPDKLHAFDLTAAAVVAYGPDSPLVGRYISLLWGQEMAHGREFEGSARILMSVRQYDLFRQLPSILHNEGVPILLTTNDLLDATGVSLPGNDSHHRSLNVVRVALTILEKADEAFQLPSVGGNTRHMRLWGHPDYRDSPLVFDTVSSGLSFTVLQHVYKLGRCTILALILPVIHHGKKFGTEAGIASPMSIKPILRKLHQEGLVHIESQGKRKPTYYSLEAPLRAAIEEALSTRTIPDSLRQMLLGEHKKDRFDVFEPTYQTVLWRVQIHRLHQSLNPHSIARFLCGEGAEPERVAAMDARIRYTLEKPLIPPWISKDTAHACILRMRAERPDDGHWLESNAGLS